MHVIFAAPAVRRDRQPGGRAVGGSRAALSDVADGGDPASRLRATLESLRVRPCRFLDERSFRRRLGLPAARFPARPRAAAAARRDHRRRPRRRRRHRGAALAPRRRHRLHQRRMGIPGRHRRRPRPRRPPACFGTDDAAASARLGLEVGGLDFFVAAIRECFEESGLLFGRAVGDRDDALDGEAADRLRAVARRCCTGASTASPRCAPRRASASTPGRWSTSATG